MLRVNLNLFLGNLVKRQSIGWRAVTCGKARIAFAVLKQAHKAHAGCIYIIYIYMATVPWVLREAGGGGASPALGEAAMLPVCVEQGLQVESGEL